MSIATARPIVKAPRRPRTVKAPHGTVRVLVIINGASYAAKPLPIDPSMGRKAWRLRKCDDGSTYDLAHLADGTLACDCPSQTFDHADHPDHPHCKHLVALCAAGLL